MSVDRQQDPINQNKPEIRNNVLEEGVECYSHWLSVEEGNHETDIPVQLELKQLEYNKDNDRLIIHDNLQNTDIEVIISNGFPVCTLCKTDDCAHTGFAICVIQNRHRERQN
ncbi:MAG: hypothetical protein MRJ93_00120 [Nitrososphaeraceae archaeon]|nr:hypothetical protein [Nitrososphaeraceae archaeon]